MDIIKVPIEWEPVSITPIVSKGKTVIPDEALHSVKKNSVALKGKLNIGHLIFLLLSKRV